MATVLESDQIRSIEQRIQKVYELPPMPELGRRILELQSDPGADARKLAAIVQLDPSLAAQVIRYASSSYYGYTGRVTNIQEAIARVLGYDLVLYLALGLAAGRSFRIPDQGPLGLTRFWEHAVCSAVLVQKLAAILPEPMRPPAGLGYLCGLLHDFGVLLLGHLFPPEFQLLNKMAQLNPGCSVAELEGRLLGMGQARDMLALGHARIGAWLMQAWKMPDALEITLLEHHNADYRGDEEILVHLVQLADFLYLNREDLPGPERLPAASLDLLQLLPEPVLETARQVFSAQKDFRSLSKLLAGTS
ncbi:MAG TPA: HDOD domain-containing protein [Gammaproteobacteria bacterium]|nr:HDOD domain-containing protein [Gammaproteobacteria bacterium]